MDLNVSSTSFGAQVKMSAKSPKMQQVSEKIQTLVKNASNGELLAGGTSASAASEASLATKFPYIAAGIAALNSFLAGTMFTDARSVKKEIAGKDSLIRQANDKLVEQECLMDEKDAKIEELQVEKECLQEENAGLAALLKYIFAIAGAGRIFAQNKEVEINSETGIIEKLAKSGRPHIFIMNHDNQKADPLMLGFFNTMLNEEYVVSEQAETCPRPRIILNEDILLTMRPKMRNIFEKLGSIGIDANLSGGNKAANGRKMVQIMKEYMNGESNIYIFPEGKNCAFKDKPLNERFQPGIAKLIERLISKTDVSVVPLGFAYNKSDKNLSAIQIGEPIVFEKGSDKDKDTILNTICGALEDAVNTAKEKIPQKTLGDKVLYV